MNYGSTRKAWRQKELKDAALLSFEEIIPEKVKETIVKIAGYQILKAKARRCRASLCPTEA